MRTAIARISLTTADAERLAAFYERALGFARVSVEERGGPNFARLMGMASAHARAVLLRLGRQEMELVAFAPPGEPYPPERASNDPWFQHFAIVVSDMAAAHARLTASAGWTPITVPKPQRLPACSGGVVAFKFRDPEGHPLELLEFPSATAPPAWREPRGAGPALGIDHSAICVADTARSVDFYERLGFAVTARSLNHGAEQDRLDGLSGAVVEVTALVHAGAPPPHLELLCYRRPPARHPLPAGSNDAAATRLVLEVDDVAGLLQLLAAAPVEIVSGGEVRIGQGRSAALLRDPDGHGICLLE